MRPVFAGGGTSVNTRVLNGGEVVLLGELVLYPQKHNGQDEAECRVDEVAESVPSAFVLETGFSLGQLVGQNGGNGL